MGGTELSVHLDGDAPAAGPPVAAGCDVLVGARDDRYAMFARYDGAEAKLFDLESDPKMNKNIAANNPDVVKRMFQDYVLKDAGGPLPSY